MFYLIDNQGNTASMEERMQHFHVPGVSVALINRGGLEWARAWGVADSATQAALTENHLLYSCSMTKFVAAMTAAALAQAGLVDLDRDVAAMTRWKLPAAENRVTLRLLLSHQAGIVDGDDCFLPLKPGQDYPDLIQILEGTTPVNTKALAFENAPGSAFAYSDNGYCLVQKVLEDATGQSLAALAGEYVFLPLDLKDSLLEQPLSPDGQRRASSGHEPDGNVTPGRYPVYPFLAAAGLWCTPRDLALMLVEVHSALRGKGIVLSQASAEALVIPHNRPYVGLGNFSHGSGEGRHIYHLGWGKGFQCAFAAWPWLGQGAVIMTNSQLGMPQNQAITGEIARGLAREYAWEEITDMLV